MLRRDTDAIVVLARGDAELTSWRLLGRGRPDLTVVEELARLQLAAQRIGCSIRLRHACAGLLELLDLVGLGDVVAEVTRPPLQVLGEAEGGEKVGVEEVVEPRDPVA